MADRQYHLKFDSSKAASVDDYLEYRRIVGDDDGGKLFTPEEYEAYKKKVLPMREKNRLFTSWSSSTGMDCKMIGPETLCFCKHRYKQHKTDFETLGETRPILLPCRVKGCKCVSYHYVPMNGSQPIRCTCKHTSEDHLEVAPFLCKKFPNTCMKCKGFYSAFTCGCGEPVYGHSTVVETAAERESRGHPVGHATPYQAMGGLTGFSSLAEGYMRLDPSGRGAPPKAFLEQAITAHDNPFLRANVHSIKAYQMAGRSDRALAPDDEVFDDLTERVSGMRRPGETDMDYFERRYQERRKNEVKGKAIEGPSTTGRRNPAKAVSSGSAKSKSSRK
ncbi:protein FAM221A-like [Liolophura sinensis]|uniref:protein FAM221A-like n=1 Tax=Liolophura sinensis TaxID=3198878 RepID=UPI003158D4DC